MPNREIDAMRCAAKCFQDRRVRLPMVQDIDTGSQGPDLWNLVLLWTFDVKSDSQPDDEYRVSAHAADHIV